MILPKPKSNQLFNEKIYLHSEMEAYSDAGDQYCKKALTVLNILLTEINVVIKSGVNGNLSFMYSDTSFVKKEAYHIEFRDEKVIVTYGDELGARNAAISLYGLIEKDDKGYFFKACNMTDFPDSEYRGLMLDLGRKFVPVEEIKITIVQMAKAKYNTLRLHLLESDHNPMQSDVYPQLNETKRRQYTKNELREIVDFAALFGLEVIPELEMPAHSLFLIDRMEELKCRTKHVDPSRWAICLGSEKTYEIMGNMIKELTEIFPGEYIHIGTDELEFTDVYKRLKLWPTWDDCELCNKLSERERLRGDRELFYYFVRRIYEIITSLGKKMMMWNDSIDCTVSPPLPRDIRIQFWRVAEKGRGPASGSMQRFLEEGFQVVNSYYPETYLDDYIEETKLLKWNPNATPESTDEVKHLILGGEMCTWGPDNHYERTLPSAVFMFGDKLWNHSDREATSEYRQVLTKAVLGLQTPANFDVFESLGCCVLPLDKVKMGKPHIVNRSKAELQANLKILQALVENNASGQAAAGVYMKCIQYVINEILEINNGKDF
ncbi:hypothetical protein Back11_62980 [Paenibacillus baekrokdamisoli]|uniref:beta-N-acetylhexosaminidase n=1 Tax=Paenibacillus baekrokdamisoli TaxID=1712516 RepID=A0A3G9JIY8_9BACL|nr:family 20 glycosylhydrolase [Paenibacillus baekrokdamisoli]MBB3069473.1 N-acetyl-beta-hexosaminidase [Paenibacillus baekrokdamisoli]BBH24953.1 hypothetical protein Back11_62980 [Paenibacillus baekrokdamisoli]